MLVMAFNRVVRVTPFGVIEPTSLYCISVSYYFCAGYISDAQNERTNRITWCTINAQEQSKCLNLSAAVARDKYKFNSKDFMELMCKQVHNIF